MPSIGTPEIIIILALALILFGPKKLPEIGRSIGQGLRELKRASREIMDTIENEVDDTPSSFAGSSSTQTTPVTSHNEFGSVEPAETEKETSDDTTDSARHA